MRLHGPSRTESTPHFTLRLSPAVRPIRSTTFHSHRTATVTLASGQRSVIGIGRVKTPTLAIVCRRELEIRSFVPEPYHEVVATAAVATGQFQMRHAPKERIKTRKAAEALAAAAEGL